MIDDIFAITVRFLATDCCTVYYIYNKSVRIAAATRFRLLFHTDVYVWYLMTSGMGIGVGECRTRESTSTCFT